MEHRCGTRYPTNIRVDVRSHGGTTSATGRLMSISLSGGFLETALGVEPLSKISLRIAEASGAAGRLWEGHVVRKTPRGLGIEWEEDISGLLQSLIKPRPTQSLRQPQRSSALRYVFPKRWV